MQKSPSSRALPDVRTLSVMAMLIAVQIILARYLSIQVSTSLRISFETIPLALAGMWLGPVPGMAVAFVSDLLGVLLSGYGRYFPPLSLGPVVFALLCGLFARHVFPGGMAEPKDWWKVAVTVVTASLVNTYAVGLFASTWYTVWYTGTEKAFGALLWANLLQRLLTKPLTIAASAAAVYLVNRAVYRPLVEKLLKPLSKGGPAA